jgi:hypothetical protein
VFESNPSHKTEPRPEMPQTDIRKRHDSIVEQSPPLVNVWGEAGHGRSAKIGQMSAR